MKIVSRTGSALGLLALASVAAFLAMPVQGAERGPLRKVPAATAAVESEARVIVKFRADSSLMRALAARSPGATATGGPQHAQALSARLGLALIDGRVLGARSQLVHAKGMSSKDLAARLSAQADVEYAVVDGRMRALAAPNDPLYASGQSATPAVGQWYLRAPDSSSIVDTRSVVSAINAEAAWAITSGKRSVVVAVLDTGVRPEHPDLAGKLLPGYDFIANAGNANDGDGRDADPTDPGDGVTAADVGTVNGCKTIDIGPSSWHGTQTAGMIGAASNNGIGMASVGHDVMLLPVRVLGKCGGYNSDIQAGLLWAAAIAVPGVPTNPHPAKVINLSLGAVGLCDAGYVDVLNQVAAQGVVVVAAAGNNGLTVGTPANCPGVIAVAGVRHAGTKVGYSDLGPEVAISAPAGNCVNTSGTCLYPLLTTSNDGTQAAGASIYTDGSFEHRTLGTSFSAPLVAGTVALMFSAKATLTPSEVLAALKGTARSFPSSGAPPIQIVTDGPFSAVSACTAPTNMAQDHECYCTISTCGAGLLDAGAAVAAVAGLTANISAASTSVVAGVPVTLSGLVSHAVTGRPITNYQWAITGGGTIARISTAINAPTATVETKAVGTVTVSLTVTDSTGQSDTTSTTLTVDATAARIVATPVSVVIGTAVALDGSGSHAPIGRTITSYLWAITSGDAIASLSGSKEAAATLATRGAGTVTVSLTVTDNTGQSATTSTAITIAAAPPASSGGGAMELGWLLGWLASVISVWVVTPRPGRQAA